jgi:dTDP-4-amino-4,6-dideoxygalactose transaminase
MFNTVTQFEETIAKWFGAPYAVATDSCTHAIELCLRLHGTRESTCPSHTYLSIPMTFRKLGIKWNWTDELWKDWYQLGNTDIIDAAVLWNANSYIAGKFMCLSFQHQKHLSLGRGGMILLNDQYAHKHLIKIAHDGRERGVPWADQNINTIGFHYYMTPETAQLGLEKFPEAKSRAPTKWSYKNYPDLRKMDIFKHAF